MSQNSKNFMCRIIFLNKKSSPNDIYVLNEYSVDLCYKKRKQSADFGQWEHQMTHS